MSPRIATSVENYETVGEGAIVKVEVEGLKVIPDEFKEIRARARALTATGFASSATGVLDDVELGEIDRLTQTEEVRDVSNDRRTDVKEYVILVDVPTQG